MFRAGALFRVLPMRSKAKVASRYFTHKTATMPSRDLDPTQRPRTPLAADFASQQELKQRGNNYHSSSLGKMINPNTVNKTSLHPGGVAYGLTSELNIYSNVWILC